MKASLWPILWAFIAPQTAIGQPNKVAIYSSTHQSHIENLANKAVVINKLGDTVQVIDRRLVGHVAVSNNGHTVAEWLTDGNDSLRLKPRLTFFRAGQSPIVAYTEPSLEQELANFKGKGWLRGDSLYHRMAKNPFYVDEDRLYLSQEDGILAVFDLSTARLIYAGKGANHFLQNYYSIPSAPYRKLLE